MEQVPSLTLPVVPAGSNRGWQSPAESGYGEPVAPAVPSRGMGKSASVAALARQEAEAAPIHHYL